jgi:hypothetical protein
MTGTWVPATQLVLVAGAFAPAGWFKLFGRGSAVVARRSALGRLTGKDRAVRAFRLVGAVELVLAAALLVPPLAPAAPIAAAAWSLAMLGYLGYAKWSAPESSCGCMSAKETPIGVRSFARAALLVAASALGVLSTAPWPVVLSGNPVPMLGSLVLEAALFVVLSAELDAYWVFPLRRFRARLRHPLRDAATGDVPVQASLHQLHRSPAYRSVHDLMRSTLLDSWDEGEWRMLTFSARQDGRRAIAVFAVPLREYEPERVRVALVDDPESEPAPAG